MKYLIRDVCLVDPKRKREEVTDVLIENGKISEISKSISASDAETIEGKGKHLVPGFIDLHTHFREPGFETKETIYTGSMAALKGGFVASVSMPNTQPACDNQGVIDLIIRKAKEVPYRIFPTGTISKGREGKELTEMADLKKVGIIGVTDDGDWVPDSLLMRRAMDYAAMLDLIVMSHCEDKRLAAGGVMNEGLSSTKLGLPGIPGASEEIAVARDIELARLTGAHLHVCHISTARAMELVRRAKQEKLRITAEVTPHHLSLTDEALEGYNTNYKMNPPLRESEDVKALRQGLREGIIDCIATDHAPHTQEDKMAEYDHAPFGVIGLETAFGVVMTELFHGEKWSLEEILRAMAVRPSEILKLGPEFGGIQKGCEANITLVDLNREWIVEPAELRSKSKNSCFMKRKLKGRVIATVCAGKLWKF
ncbi:MAG: dihydroorotase [Candidatus Omnitrophica bacterium]|nr:dihydroorotase [Candidatus Omnitrophota bacterium]